MIEKSAIRTTEAWVRSVAAQSATRATLATLIVFWVLELITVRLADLPVGELRGPFLPLAAVSNQPVLAAVVSAFAVGWLVHYRSAVNLRWADLEHGARLRAVAGVLMTVVVWRLATNAHNYLFEEWYAPDRILLVLLLVAALFRPAVMILLVAEARLLQAPLRASGFLTAGLEIDELAVQVILVFAATAVVVVVTGKHSTSAALPVMAAAVAAQFFLPGRTKVRAGWFDNEIGNLPLSGYYQGWLGAGDGAFAQSFSDLISPVEPILVAVTLAFELGAIAMLLGRRLLASWTLAALGFHLLVLLSIGFVFFEFAVVEVAVLVLVYGASGREWSLPAFRPGPTIIAAAAILLGPILFDSPPLTWFDSPLVYRYEVDGIDAGGRRWELVAGDFAPYDDVLAFADLGLGPTAPIVGAYGAASRDARDLITTFETFDDVTSAEGEWSDAVRSERVVLLEQFLLSTSRDRGLADRLPRPPQHFQTSRPGVGYDFELPLVRLEVERVTTLRVDDEELVRREPVVVVEQHEARPAVTWADD